MGNKSKNGRTTRPKDPVAVSEMMGGPQQPLASVNPEKVIGVLRQKLEASEHRNVVLEIALGDAKEELAAMRAQFDEFAGSVSAEGEEAPKPKKEKKK